MCNAYYIFLTVPLHSASCSSFRRRLNHSCRSKAAETCIVLNICINLLHMNWPSNVSNFRTRTIKLSHFMHHNFAPSAQSFRKCGLDALKSSSWDLLSPLDGRRNPAAELRGSQDWIFLRVIVQITLSNMCMDCKMFSSWMEDQETKFNDFYSRGCSLISWIGDD